MDFSKIIYVVDILRFADLYVLFLGGVLEWGCKVHGEVLKLV